MPAQKRSRTSTHASGPSIAKDVKVQMASQYRQLQFSIEFQQKVLKSSQSLVTHLQTSVDSLWAMMTEEILRRESDEGETNLCVDNFEESIALHRLDEDLRTAEHSVVDHQHQLQDLNRRRYQLQQQCKRRKIELKG